MCYGGMLLVGAMEEDEGFLLFKTIFVRFFMAFECIFFMRVLVFNFGMFRLVNFLTECLCMVSLTLVVMVMRGLVFHPLFCMVLISGSNLVCFCSRASLGILS